MWPVFSPVLPANGCPPATVRTGVAPGGCGPATSAARPDAMQTAAATAAIDSRRVRIVVIVIRSLDSESPADTRSGFRRAANA